MRHGMSGSSGSIEVVLEECLMDGGRVGGNIHAHHHGSVSDSGSERSLFSTTLCPTPLCPTHVCHLAVMCRCLRLLESCCQHFLETLQPFEGQHEHEISNYLYNRSKEIEPKNCKKPPIKDRKWPTSFLKSPGIKPRNSRTVPNPLPIIRGHNKLADGGDGDDTPHMITPPTPSTPCTPPHTAADNSIFAPVEIGSGGGVLGSGLDNRVSSSGYPFSGTGFPALLHPLPPPVTVNPHLPPTAPPSAVAVAATATTTQVPPPPLPPRRKREPSIGDTSPKVKQAPDAPELPPRDVSPPPIPPRTSTLPRMHSSGGLQHGPTHHHHVPPGHSLHSVNLHHHVHHHLGHHHRPSPPSLLAPPPPPQQYQLDPPPHRRNNSMDLSSPTPMARRHTNGPHAGLPGSSMNDGPAEPSDHPPTPPPRLAYRHTFSFSYDHHQS